MGKRLSRKNQKIYRMKGCSKKTCKNRLNHLGGSGDINLAYTGQNVATDTNPFLAYTGGSCDNSLTPSLVMPLNPTGGIKTLPSTGPINNGLGTYFLNPQGAQRGGCCGCGMPLRGATFGLMNGGSCGTCGLMNGGSKGGCGQLCALGFMVGGKRHRVGCKCTSCKKKGGSQLGGNPGIPYANGLVGDAWTTSTSGWPGVDGISGNRNFIADNTYKNDVQTAMIASGAQPPFSVGGRRKTEKQRGSKKQRGGALDNFLGQDLINLGRQFQYGIGSAYNALAGYSAPINPLPWKGQLANTSSLSTIRSAGY